MPKLLIAVDHTPASVKVLEFMSSFARADLPIVLLRYLDPVPAELSEIYGKTEYPYTEKEQRVVDRVNKRRADWLRKETTKARAFLNKCKSRLRRAGMAKTSINIVVREAVARGDLAKDMLKAAKELDCDTVAVGRHSFPWFKELLRPHVGDELVRKGQGLTICVIE